MLGIVSGRYWWPSGCPCGGNSEYLHRKETGCSVVDGGRRHRPCAGVRLSRLGMVLEIHGRRHFGNGSQNAPDLAGNGSRARFRGLDVENVPPTRERRCWAPLGVSMRPVVTSPVSVGVPAGLRCFRCARAACFSAGAEISVTYRILNCTYWLQLATRRFAAARRLASSLALRFR